MKFKMLKTLFIAASLITFVGCSNKEVEDVNEKKQSSMFEIGNITVQGSQVYAQNKNWPDLKNRMVISMTACLQDSVYAERIIGADFQVKSQATDLTDTTKVSGCLYWNEVVDFNYLGKEDYLVISGELIGKGKFKGSQPYDVIINPWKNEAMAMQSNTDYKFFELRDSSKVFTSFSNSLYLDDVEYTVEDKQFSMTGSKVKLLVKLNPEFKRLGADGTLKRNFFSQGIFNVQYFLIEKDFISGARNVIASTYSGGKVLKDGNLLDNITFDIKDDISSNSIIEIGVALEGSDAPEGLGSVSGVFQIESLAGVKTASFRELTTLNLNNLTAKAYTRNSNYDANFGIVVDEIDFLRGKTAISKGQKLVTVNTIVCLADPLLKLAVQDHQFRVRLINAETGEITFDEERKTNYRGGCLKVNPEILYSDLDTRNWMKFHLEVSSTQSPFYSVVKSRPIYINPWIENDDFGIDSKNLSDGELPVVLDPAAPKFYIENFSYKKLIQ